MKFSEQDLDILSAVSVHGSDTVSRIAKTAGVKEHAVRYFLHRMVSEGSFRPFTFVNHNPAGFLEFSFYFSIIAESEKRRSTLLQALMSSPAASWLNEYVGDYQYGMSVFARSAAEALELFSNVSSKTGVLFSRISCSQIIAEKFFPLKYFNRTSKPSLRIAVEPTEERIELSEIDTKILSIFSRDYGVSVPAIARSLGLPGSTVSYRIKRLREHGVILASSFIPVHSKFGRTLYKLLIWTRFFNKQLTDSLEHFSAEEPLVTLFVRSFGVWNYEINVVAESSEEVSRLIRKLHSALGASLAEIKVLTVVHRHKLRTSPFLEPAFLPFPFTFPRAPVQNEGHRFPK